MAVEADHSHAAPALAHEPSNFWKLLLGSIGVVYGDIGTSPLYAFREAVVHSAADGLLDSEVIGVVSMLFWALMIVVTIKYVLFIMQADNNGEGGTLSLLALVQRVMGRKMFLALIGVVGASLFYGDAVITPAISVLSAMEGLKLVTPALDRFVLPITIVILIVLFAVQSRGTGRIATFFGPVTLVWFVVIGVLGLLHIGDRPDILHALNPLNSFRFIAEHGFLALIVLGSVFLAITGAEALYADMGHFGRKPIRVAWIFLVFPALTLNYLGQGALVMADPAALENPFYLLAPDWFRLPLVILAAMATVIASQAVITGAFSLTQQAIQLGLLPRLEIQHTSEEQFGQIYIPKVNFLLFIGVMVLVLTFQTSGRLASAYGIAVTGNMMISSILAFFFLWRFWRWPALAAALAILPFLALESIFLGSNLLKVLDGGYAPLGLATVLTIVMWTWMRGTRIVYAKARRESIALTDLTHMLERSHPMRARGTAVFLTSDTQMAPSALMHNLKHNGVLHERNLIMTVIVENTPRVAEEERVRIEPASDLFTRVFLSFGYMEEPNVPKAMQLAKKKGLKFEIMSTSFFLSRRVFRATASVGMPQWQDRVYISMAISAADMSNYYCLPTNRVVEMGQQFTI